MRRLDSPYVEDHDASLSRKGAPPKGLPGLLRWLIDGFRDEMPDKVHAGPLWVDRKRSDDKDDYKPVGGSLLGTPGTNDAFRILVEGSPFTLEVAEYEGHKDTVTHYRTPTRAAIARLGGRGPDHDERPFMARVLLRTCYMDGDWDAACASFDIPEPVRRTYIEAALYRLWRVYEIEPPARPIESPAEAA